MHRCPPENNKIDKHFGAPQSNSLEKEYLIVRGRRAFVRPPVGQKRTLARGTIGNETQVCPLAGIPAMFVQSNDIYGGAVPAFPLCPETRRR